MATKIAKYGEPSNARVISAWPEKSSSSTTTYEVQLHEDGVLTCNCPGWVRAVKTMDYDLRKGLPFKTDQEDGETFRTCRHCKEHLYDAGEIMCGRKKPIFQQDAYEPTYIPPKTKQPPKVGVGRLIEREED